MALVTGASSGIGLEICRGLLAAGRTVVAVARDAGRMAAAAAPLRADGAGERLHVELCDLASQAEVRALADRVLGRWPALDVLVHNAGLTLGARTVSPDGLETTLAVNHLAPFLLTHLLLPALGRDGASRVVTVASDAHRRARLDLDDLGAERRFRPWIAYCNSKLCNVLFTAELARRAAAGRLVASCLHPGVVATGFGRGGPLPIRLFFRLFAWTLIGPAEGARTAVWLATADEAGRRSGRYFERCREVRPSRAAADPVLARRLWEESARLTGIEALPVAGPPSSPVTSSGR